MTDHSTALAVITLLGITAQWISWRIGLPSILLLLVFGIGAGHWIDPDGLFGNELLFACVSLAVAVIMYEGGLTLKIGELPAAGGTVRNLVTFGAAATWLLTAVAAHYILGLDAPLAVLLAAVLVVTGPTVIAPMLRHIRPTGAVGPILKWEGIVIDPIGALLAVLVYEAVVLNEHGEVTGHLATAILKTVVCGGGLGVLAAIILILLLQRHLVADYLESAVSLMLVVGSFAAANHIQHESGLLTVTVMGFILANQRRADVRHIVEFKENLRVLLISVLFIVLAARLDIDRLRMVLGPGLIFVGVLILIIRPAATLLSTYGSGLSWPERGFLAWMAPRGIVAAAVSSVFAIRLEAAGFADANLLVSYTFLTIIVTVTIYALTGPLLARRLGVSEANPQGILFAGAQGWVCAIARTLQREGFAVLLVDTNRENIRAARMDGIRASDCSILGEGALDELELGGLGRLAAVTPNDWVNILAVQRFRSVFGKAQCFQVAPPPESARQQQLHSYLQGKVMFDTDATAFKLQHLHEDGWTVRATKLTDEFDYEAFRSRNPNAILLFAISGKALSVFSAESDAPENGTTIISMTRPE